MIDLAGLTLSKGAHETADDECCVMEAVAIAACAVKDARPAATWREALDRFRDCKTDHPADACPVIGSVMRSLNDWMTNAERVALLPYTLRLIGTRGAQAVTVRRAFVAADVAVREFAPIALAARGFADEAATLRALPEIKDRASALEGRKAAAAANAAAYAAAAADAAARATRIRLTLALVDRMLAVTA
jgi:predicted nuclease with RNAse H fold